MPQVIEIPIDVAKVTTTPFRSDIFPLNNAQRATLIVQTSASLTTGQWVLKTTPTPDTAIPGHIILTVDFPATPARVKSGTVEVAHKYAYVEQITAPTGGTVEKISIYLE